MLCRAGAAFPDSGSGGLVDEFTRPWTARASADEPDDTSVGSRVGSLDAESGAGEVTRLLHRLGSGDERAASELYPLVYEALRGVAGRALARERAGHSMQRTELVHEAYLRLLGSASVSWQDRAHFLAVAARAMRQVLVDHARKRDAAKRGGGVVARSLEDASGVPDPADVLPPDELLALDDALARLEELAPRLRAVVEYRFFAGLGERDIAHVLGVTERTVQRDWVKARAWLHKEIYGAT
jgi:RNA polymerase sigma factor (TIGR02999 family)